MQILSQYDQSSQALVGPFALQLLYFSNNGAISEADGYGRYHWVRKVNVFAYSHRSQTRYAASPSARGNQKCRKKQCCREYGSSDCMASYIISPIGPCACSSLLKACLACITPLLLRSLVLGAAVALKGLPCQRAVAS